MATTILRTRPEALGLYHRLLKATYKWPTDPKRQGRNLQEYLSKAIRSDFAKNKAVKDETLIRKLIDNGNKQLQALDNLLNNKYAEQVHFYRVGSISTRILGYLCLFILCYSINAVKLPSQSNCFNPRNTFLLNTKKAKLRLLSSENCTYQ